VSASCPSIALSVSTGAGVVAVLEGHHAHIDTFELGKIIDPAAPCRD